MALPLLCIGLGACNYPKDPEMPGFTMHPEEFKYGAPVHDVIETPNGYELSYFRYGDPNGRRVIFLHGTPGTNGIWYTVLPDMPEGFEVIAVDRPGWGKTTPYKVLPSLSEQAKALQPLLNTPGRGTPLIAGWSYGGPVAAQLAVDFPSEVGGLLMVSASLDPDLEHTYFIQYLGRALAWVIPDQLDHANKELMALEAQLQALEPRLKEVRQDVEILHGTADEMVPYGNVAFMEKAFANTKHLKVQTIEDGIHQMPIFTAKHMWAALLRLDGRAEEAAAYEKTVPSNCGGVALHCLPDAITLVSENEPS